MIILTSTFLAAGPNEIAVNSVKDSNLTVDEELRDQLTVDGYKKQYGNVAYIYVHMYVIVRLTVCQHSAVA